MQGLYAFPLDLWQARASDGVSANDCGIARRRQAGLLRKEAHKLRFRDRRVRVETTRRRAAAYGKRISSGGFPAMNPSRCRSHSDPELPVEFSVVQRQLPK